MGGNDSHGGLSDDEREDLLELYEGLRVTDVTDGLDTVGYHDVNQLSREIRPLWRDIEDFTHRAVGFAHTVRFHPTNKKRPNPEWDREMFEEWKGDWYSELAPDAFVDDIREDDMLVIEAHAIDMGPTGSNNSLGWYNAGAVGVVSNGGARDTDEVVKQGKAIGYPVYVERITKTIRPGRVELDDTQIPVSVGQCKIRPEDVVVADGDGVVVVPIEDAEEVAEVARDIQSDDQEGRRQRYREAGIKEDFTLE